MIIKQKRTVSRIKLEQMTATLREEIITGIRKTGDFLPSELSLCEQYNLSNFAVRKGLDVLVSEGYIEKLPKIGTRVIASTQNEEITIRLGYYPTMVHNNYMFEVLEAFHKQHPTIRIQPMEFRYPYTFNKLEVEILTESYDVIMINLHHFDRLAGYTDENTGSGILEPIEPVEGVSPFLYKPLMRRGTHYAQPLMFSPVILCYNKDHFRELNLPEPDSSWTWNDVKEAGVKLSQGKDRFGLYFYLKSENRWPLFLLQNGVVFERNEHGKYNFRDPKFIDSMKRLMDIIGDQTVFPNFLSDGEKDECPLFLNQKVSMVLTTYDHLSTFHDATFDYDIAPIPYLQESRTLLHIMSLCVSSSSKQKQAAKTFIAYMLSYETQLALRNNTLRIPALKLAAAAEWTAKEPQLNRPSHYSMYRDIIPSYSINADLNLSHNELSAICNELKYYWSGIDDLETVLQRLEEKL